MFLRVVQSWDMFLRSFCDGPDVSVGFQGRKYIRARFPGQDRCSSELSKFGTCSCEVSLMGRIFLLVSRIGNIFVRGFQARIDVLASCPKLGHAPAKFL